MTTSVSVRPLVLDVRDYGAAGDGTTDDTTAIQNAIAAANAAGGGMVFFPDGNYKTTATIKTYEDVTLQGIGKESSINPSAVSGSAILTYQGSGSTTTPNQAIRDLNIGGSATCAIAFAHCPLMKAERITLNGFTGTDGFVFEYLWGGHFANLSTNGATITRAPFKVNKVVLDSVWDLPYTSNAAEFSLYIDKNKTEYSTGASTGFGRLEFRTLTMQGATVAGLCMPAFDGPIAFTNIYTESVRIPLLLGSPSVNSSLAHFYSCNLTGDVAATPFVGLIQKTTGVDFYSCYFDDTHLVIGNVNGAVTLNNCVRVSSADIWAIIDRTGDTPGGMPLTILGSHNEHSKLFVKTTGYSYTFREMVVDNTGAWSTTSKSPTLNDWQPITSLTYSAGTATAVSASHGYSTSDSIVIEGASPNAFNGTYTITVTDANTFTYTPGSAPSPTTAIGVPMVKR